MKVGFSDRAMSRLRQIHRYIAGDNPIAAERVTIRIRQTVELLVDMRDMVPLRLYRSLPTRRDERWT